MNEPNPYRELPPVDVLVSEVQSSLPTPLVADVVRMALDQARSDIAEGRSVDARTMAEKLIRTVERSGEITLINATGVLLHTNLGRARWSERAIRRGAEAAGGATNLEIDVATGKRGRRGGYVTTLLRSLTGAEDALVVNNNASALLLSLSAIAAGKAVPVARGELIEIGGSYRLPDVMETSGARLVEVGTTNRTRAADFVTALQINTCGAVLKVHPSNYRVEGFTETPSVGELAGAAAGGGVPLIYDIGSGLLDAETPWLEGPTPDWLRDEPAARQAMEAGADVVSFSGDKLLGGPQAGIVIGTSESIERLRSDAMTRALRVDGVTYAALAATLEAYLDRTVEEIPFWRQALLSGEEISTRAVRVAEKIGASVVAGHSTIGAGSVPGTTIPGPLVVLPDGDHLYEPLLAVTRPVLTRREGGALVIDLRTADPGDDDVVVDAILRCR